MIRTAALAALAAVAAGAFFAGLLVLALYTTKAA